MLIGSDSEADLIVDLVQQVDLLLCEDKVAEAAVLLFDINKTNHEFWFRFKVSLLSACYGHRELFLTATLVEVAERDYLSQSFNLVPGLYSLVKSND